jgi:hypothetical protein
MFVYGVLEMASQITTGANAWTALVILAWGYLQTTGFALAKTQRDNLKMVDNKPSKNEKEPQGALFHVCATIGCL